MKFEPHKVYLATNRTGKVATVTPAQEELFFNLEIADLKRHYKDMTKWPVSEDKVLVWLQIHGFDITDAEWLIGDWRN